MRPSATELESLERLSTIVPDTLLMREVSSLGQPKAASVTPRILSNILSSQASFPVYKNAIEKGMAFSRDPKTRLNKALANVGAMFSTEVEGRVATQLDPRSAHDTNEMVNQVKELLKMYTDMGVNKDRLIFQVPATWEGIKAVERLEKQGICTIVQLIFSFCQAVSAAQVGASVILINMGRVEDWYHSHPGVIRDPLGPREDAGGISNVHPGRELVKKVYGYCRRHHPKTKIMVSGVRTREDALSVAGVDFIVLGPKVLTLLNEVPTAEGYNYDLSGVDSTLPVFGVEEQMSASMGLEDDQELPLDKVTVEHFAECLGYAGKDLLDRNVQRQVDNINQLLPLLSTMTLGME